MRWGGSGSMWRPRCSRSRPCASSGCSPRSPGGPPGDGAANLVSLALANVALPALLRGIELPPDVADAEQERAARAETLKAALDALSETAETQTAGTPPVAMIVADHYRHRLDQLQAEGIDGGTAAWPEERRMHLLAIQAERRSIVSRVRQRLIPIDLAHRLLRETDAEEVALPIGPGRADRGDV